MRNFILYFTLILFGFAGKSQNTILCRMHPTDSHVMQIKWYSPTLITAEGCFIYRRETGSMNWQKINNSPVVFKSYKIPDAAFKEDKELKSYTGLAASASNIKDLALLAALIKSFKSDAFSNYLGIRYDDTSVENGKEYEYKITLRSDTGEKELGISKKIIAGLYSPINPPNNIESKNGNKKVSFTWEPEPTVYFGVNIYRKTSDTGQYHKITKEPILLSKTKNKKGEEAYGQEFFVDTRLKPHMNYYYQFEALDFFGSPSYLSKPVLIVLKDLDCPKSPDSIYNSLDGKKVTLKWKKKNKEEDLAGYNIYRTNKSDTDFVKLNKNVVPLHDSVYMDTVLKFRSYMYAVSSIDADGNESVSNPFHIEVFDNEPPLIPKNVTIQADSGRLILHWKANTEEDLKGYLLYRTINKNSEDTYVKMTPTPLTQNTYTDVLPKNIKNAFLYKVVAVDESMNRSGYSDFAAARMPDVTAPESPFLKTISMNEKKQIRLDWLANTEPDLAGYNLYRKNRNDSASHFQKLNTKLLDARALRYTDRNAEEETLYEYYVEASDSAGNYSKRSNSIKFKLKTDEEETKIKIVAFEAHYNTKRKQVILKWNIKNTDDLKGYVIYKLNQDETIFSPISGTLEENAFLDNAVTEDSLYTYQLRVYDQKGDVYKSEKITLTIK